MPAPAPASAPPPPPPPPPPTPRLRRTPLRPVFWAGLALVILFSWSIAFFILAAGGKLKSDKAKYEDPFDRELRVLDRLIQREAGEAEIERMFRELRKHSRGVEDTMSILKRRRGLAQDGRSRVPAYAAAAREAAARFPYSEAAAAAAAEAIIMEGGGSAAGKDAQELSALAGRLHRSQFPAAAFAARALSGDLASPERAAAIPGLEALLTEASLSLPLRHERRRALAADALLLTILRGEIPEASVRLSALISQGREEGAGRGLYRFGAEFFYDFGNPLRAAALLAKSTDEGDMALEADALYLGGETAGAKTIWGLLAVPEDDAGPKAPAAASSAARRRALFNLASLSASEDGEAAKGYLERLFAAVSGEDGGALPESALYGLILYTRLLDAPRSIAVLGDKAYGREPLLDLELLRRRLTVIAPDRGPAEVWLLLGRHPDAEALYRWGAWYFDYQHNYGETARLLKEAGRRGFSGEWLALHRALSMFRAGDLREGERLLTEAASPQNLDSPSAPASAAAPAGTSAPAPRAAPAFAPAPAGTSASTSPPAAAHAVTPAASGAGEVDWAVYANLGAALAAEGSYAAAMARFETASALLLRPPALAGGLSGPASAARRKTASIIQVRIARCLRAMRHDAEIRRVLEYALALDKDNMDAALELRRLDRRGKP